MEPHSQYRIGRFQVDLEARRVALGTASIDLPYRSFEALQALVEGRGAVVDRDALHRRIWPDAVVDDASLNKCVSDLRKAFAEHDAETEYVETVRGRGYRLAVPAEPVEAAAAAQEPAPSRAARAPWKRLAAAAALVALAAAGYSWWRNADLRRQVEDLRDESQRLYRAQDYPAAAIALRAAIRMAPDNGPAHSELAHVVHKIRDATSAPGPAIELAEKGVALAPDCGKCQGTLGFFLFYHGWEWRRAQRHYAEALRLAPDVHSIRPSYAFLLAATGNLDEALRQAEIAAEDAPLAAGRHAALAQILYLNRRYLDAAAAADRALGFDRKRKDAWEYRARAELAQGRVEDAVRTMLAERYKHHQSAVGKAVDEGGGKAGMSKLLELTGGWPERSEISWRRAAWFASLGEDEAAIEALEDAVAQKNINLMFTAVDPLYDRIQGRPRFRALLEKMGLEAPLATRAAGRTPTE